HIKAPLLHPCRPFCGKRLRAIPPPTLASATRGRPAGQSVGPIVTGRGHAPGGFSGQSCVGHLGPTCGCIADTQIRPMRIVSPSVGKRTEKLRAIPPPPLAGKGWGAGTALARIHPNAAI